MNVSDSAYRLGVIIKKSHLGREHNKIYQQLLLELSDSSKYHISDILSKQNFVGFGNHFYSFLILNDILEENKDNDYFKKDIEEIFSKDNYYELLRISKLLGDELEETLLNVYRVDKDIKFFGTKNEEIPKLRRALVDLQRQIQRTGFIEWSLINLRDQSLLSKYEEKRETYPFYKENVQLRNTIASNDDELKILDNIEMILMMMGYIKQVIFHAHMGNIIEINLENAEKYKFVKFNNFKIGVLIIKDELILKKSFLIKVRDGFKTNYGIASSINMHFNNLNGDQSMTTKFKMYLLPENDTDIFRYKILLL